MQQTELATNGETVPDGNGVFRDFDIVGINSSGSSSILGSINSTGGATNDTGIFVSNVTSQSQIVREGQAPPLGGGLFTDFDFSTRHQINNNGSVAVEANVIDQTIQRGLYVGSGGELTQIALQGVTSPDGGATFFDFFDFRLHDNEDVTFFATSLGVTGRTGIYRGNGGDITSIVRADDSAVGGDGTIRAIQSNLGINESGAVAFRALLSGNGGGASSDAVIYRHDGSVLTQVAREGQLSPDGNGTIGNFDDFSFGSGIKINESNEVMFTANLVGTTNGEADNTSIFLEKNGSLVKLAREGETTPDGNGTFSAFGSRALNDAGVAAMMVDLTNTSGGSSDNRAIFLTDGIDLIQVARKGELVDGSSILNLGFSGTSPGFSSLNKYGQLAYRANLAGSVSNIVNVFTPELHWRSNSNGNWSSSNNWTLGLNPDSVHDVVLNSNTDRIIALDTAGKANHLTLGGGSATTELKLDGNGLDLQLLSIESNGILSGGGLIDGDLVSAGMIRPGDSPGLIELSGSLALLNTSLLEMEIQGTSQGSTHDAIVSKSGIFTLGGTLDVQLLNGFAPTLGDTFDLFDWGSSNGSFDSVLLPTLDQDLFWNTSQLYSNGVLSISSVPEPGSTTVVVIGLIGALLTRRKRTNQAN